MSLVAGQTGGTVDYYPTRGGDTYDPVLNGGSMTSMTIFDTDGTTELASSTDVAKVTDGQYRFTFATAIASAGNYPVTTVWSATGTGPVVTDTTDTVRVEAFGGQLIPGIYTLEEFDLYLQSTADPDVAGLLRELVTGLVAEVAGSSFTETPVSTTVKAIALNAAARAYLNPQGLSSVTIDDYTARRDSSQAGVFLTADEQAQVAGEYTASPSAFTVRPYYEPPTSPIESWA